MMDYSKYLTDDGFVIFLFHGVIKSNPFQVRNYTHKHINEDFFKQMLGKLVLKGSAVSMLDIIAANYGEYDLPSRAFAITFDDGFENNYSVAAPIMRSFEVPATIYITTNFIESGMLSWIDMMEYALEHTRKTSILIPGSVRRYPLLTIEQKIQVLDIVRHMVKSNPNIDPYSYAEEFCQCIDVCTIISDDNLDGKMSWNQVIELDNDQLFTIGGHSHTHRILSYLDKEDLQKEINVSLSLLKQKLGHNVTHYSYPEGMKHCYSDTVINELKKHGILCSPSAEFGVNHQGDDLFHLKRIAVV